MAAAGELSDGRVRWQSMSEPILGDGRHWRLRNCDSS
jgi:hypothetical protein